MTSIKTQLATLALGIPFDPIPGPQEPILNYSQDASVPHAPIRVHGLTKDQKKVRSPNLMPKRIIPQRTCSAIAQMAAHA